MPLSDDGGELEGVRFEPSLDTKAAYGDFVEQLGGVHAFRGIGHLCELCGRVDRHPLHQTRPIGIHEFQGRSDRPCVVCGSPDRSIMHKDANGRQLGTGFPVRISAPPDPCPRGFVPEHGFGRQRTCATCGRLYEDHRVVVQ